MIALASIFVLGIFAQWLSWKIKQPAILPLILIGLLIGPVSTFLTSDGTKLVDGDAIFSGDLLFSFVSIAVGVILFEGGLTLNLKEVRTVAKTVRNLLVIGSLITFLGGGLAAHLIMGLSWKMALLFGALIIVSGPTVIIPILRNVKPNANINTILKWEGILIDPFGALVAVLVYEFISSAHHEAGVTMEVFQEFFITISSGVVTGLLGAFFLYYLLKNNALPEYLKNVFTLGLVIFTFAFAELIHQEAGLMAATIMGIVLANLKVEDLNKILSFKEDISLILISVLFILLSSRIEIVQIEKLGLASILLFAVVALIIRPLGVLLSTFRSHLSVKEKLFISWIGPKGIVAAAVASLFSLNLLKSESSIDPREAELLLPLVFLIIVGTVIIQGSSAKWIAGLLGVRREDPTGYALVGANELARKIGLQIQEAGGYCVLIDTARHNIYEARKVGLRALEANVLSDSIFEEIDLARVGKLAALTSNSGLNELACRWFEKELGSENVLRLASKEEVENTNLPLPKNILFKTRDDFVSLIQLLRKKEPLDTATFEALSEYEEFMEKHRKQIVPLIASRKEHAPEIINGYTNLPDKTFNLLFIKRESYKVEKEE